MLTEYWEKMSNMQKGGAVSFLIFIIIVIALAIYYGTKSSFTGNLSTPINQLTTNQPNSFPPLDKPISDFSKLYNPVVPEEIGLSQVYPQGGGVGMDLSDSNSFTPTKPGPLLTDHTIPESYGESSLTDPTGINGANQGARVIKLTSAGNQMIYKPHDESESVIYSQAYSDGEVQSGYPFINGAKQLDYSDSFNPEHNLTIQTSPGQESTLNNCEKTYPGVVKYGDFCITEGDIPYGKEVNGKVNPRLVSRWESYTGDYSRQAALESVDGLLYPQLNVLTN
jgi:hypothetical protein